MINKIKIKIKSIEQNILFNKQVGQDQLALNQLLKMFDKSMFLPLTTWSICPRVVQHICNDIVVNDRKRIVEFGSGFSTFCIAQLLKLNRIDAKFISVESNEEWFNKINSQLKILGLSNYVKVILAPISIVKKEISLAEQDKWYNVSSLTHAFEKVNKFDLVIVDGPIGNTTKFARYSAIPFLLEKLNESFTIFLDDTGRHDEKLIVTEWKKILKCKAIDRSRYTVLKSESDFESTPINN